jgi:hypothetical protein
VRDLSGIGAFKDKVREMKTAMEVNLLDNPSEAKDVVGERLAMHGGRSASSA